MNRRSMPCASGSAAPRLLDLGNAEPTRYEATKHRTTKHRADFPPLLLSVARAGEWSSGRRCSPSDDTACPGPVRRRRTPIDPFRSTFVVFGFGKKGPPVPDEDEEQIELVLFQGATNGAEANLS